MKEIRTFGKYKYSVEMEPEVSLTVNESEKSSNITWDFHIDLIEYPDGLTNDMVRGILNFIGEMEKSAIRESMKGAMNSFTIKDDSLPGKITNPYETPYTWSYGNGISNITLCTNEQHDAETGTLTGESSNARTRLSSKNLSTQAYRYKENRREEKERA